jgi:hypothetical protein
MLTIRHVANAADLAVAREPLLEYATTLDVVPEVGFKEIPRYRFSLVEGNTFMELLLDSDSA